MRPYHAFHVFGTAQPEATGIARLVGAIASGIDPARFRVHAWFLRGNGPLATELRNLGVTVCVVPWSNGLRDPVGMWRFSRQLRKQAFAIVHQHDGGRAVRWITRLSQGSQILVYLHGRIMEKQGVEPISIDVQAADLAIATPRAVAERVRGVPAQVVYPGVPIAQEPPPKLRRPIESTVLVGTAARLVAVKGIIHLIRAVHLLRSQCPHVRLEIAGAGPEETTLRAEVQKLGLTGCVTFLGWQSDLQPLFARWDIFALPSLEEAFGIAVVEAMAAGLPVIATNVGGIPEIIENDKTGLLVAPADPHAFAESLAQMLADPPEQRRLGAAGWVRVREKFSQQQMVSSVERIYERLVADRSSRAARPRSLRQSRRHSSMRLQ